MNNSRYFSNYLFVIILFLEGIYLLWWNFFSREEFLSKQEGLLIFLSFTLRLVFASYSNIHTILKSSNKMIQKKNFVFFIFNILGIVFFIFFMVYVIIMSSM